MPKSVAKWLSGYHKNVLIQYLKILNIKALTVVADMAKEQDIDRLIDSVVKHFGRLDVLVNNAGIGGGAADEDPKVFDHYINVNLRSVYHLCLRAKPFLEKSKGSIVNISSINGLKPVINS